MVYQYCTRTSKETDKKEKEKEAAKYIFIFDNMSKQLRAESIRIVKS